MRRGPMEIVTDALGEEEEEDSLFTPTSPSDSNSPISPHASTSTQRQPLQATDSPSGSRTHAARTAPPIPGLYLFPDSIFSHNTSDGCQPHEQDHEAAIIDVLIDTYFRDGSNQAMLFGTGSKSFPPVLDLLLRRVETMLRAQVDRGHLTEEVFGLLFPSIVPRVGEMEELKRQAIINFYLPGEGISSHVDLLGRYGDGIIGISLGSGCTMTFRKAAPGQTSSIQDPGFPLAPLARHDVYLPRGSVYILSGEARYKWEHGIEEREEDWVDGELLARRERLSVTFRWMLKGADVVGG